jgi:hypothetical protein
MTPMPARLPLGQFMSAASAFVWAHQATGRSLPEAVSLRELVAGGYLDREQARGFDGAEVSLSLAPDQSRPQAVRMLVQLADGHALALFNDGSVQSATRRN